MNNRVRFATISVALVIVILATLFMSITITMQKESPQMTKVIITVGQEINASSITPDYIGTSSAVVQQAINALPVTGGEIVLVSPTYTFTGTVSRAINNVTIKGVNGTTVANNASTPLFSVGSQTGWKFEDIKTDGGGITNYDSTLLVNVTLGTNYYAFYSPNAGSSDDGIYFDAGYGVSGTTYPIGTSAKPSNNEADCFTMATARNLRKIYIMNAEWNNAFVVPENATGLSFIGRFHGGATGISYINCNGKTFTNCEMERLNLVGTAYSNDNLRAYLCATIGQSVNESWEPFTVDSFDFYDCLIDYLKITSSGFLYNCYGEASQISSDGCGAFYTVNCVGNWTLLNLADVNETTPYIQMYNFNGIVNVDSGCTAALLEVYGNTKIQNNATNPAVLIYQHTSNIQKEIGININAISSGETIVLNLEQGSNSNKIEFELTNVVLKCANPSTNTVTVRLYRNVNSVLTVVKTFSITSANYTNYFNLYDLFSQQIIQGEAIKITVQSNSGTYAVTGSYSIKSY